MLRHGGGAKTRRKGTVGIKGSGWVLSRPSGDPFGFANTCTDCLQQVSAHDPIFSSLCFKEESEYTSLFRCVMAWLC
eukprot:1160815-Pelagomonas_calceolata.AAC.1